MEVAGRLGTLLLNATAIGPGGHAGPAPKGNKTVQAYLAGSGVVTCTVKLEVSIPNPSTWSSSWITAGTFVLSGTSVVTDGFFVEGPWAYWRANITAISGSGATLNFWVNQ